MDDPTKDTIPRSAVEYYLRKETVNTNPYAYESHERFIVYMDDPDISQFGHWMHSNGFNCALVSIAVDLDKIPSVTPSAQQWIPCSERLPENRDWVLGIFQEGDTGWINPIPFICDYVGKKTHITTQDNWLLKMVDEPHPYYERLHCIAWMPLPESYKGDKDGE